MTADLHLRRSNQENKLRKYVLSIQDKEYHAEVKNISTEKATVIVNDHEYQIDLKEIGRKTEPVQVSQPSTAVAEPKASAKKATTPAATATPKSSVHVSGQGVPAPLPGLILDIHVKLNDSVKSGQTIALMEAMKMENQIKAPHDGKVKNIFVSKGDSVSEGDIILEIERPVMTSL